MASASSTNETRNSTSKVLYNECFLAIHEKPISNDMCRKFVAGMEGTTNALKCEVCGCHRVFHRQVVVPQDFSGDALNLYTPPPPMNPQPPIIKNISGRELRSWYGGWKTPQEDEKIMNQKSKKKDQEIINAMKEQLNISNEMQQKSKNANISSLRMPKEGEKEKEEAKDDPEEAK